MAMKLRVAGRLQWISTKGCFLGKQSEGFAPCRNAASTEVARRILRRRTVSAVNASRTSLFARPIQNAAGFLQGPEGKFTEVREGMRRPFGGEAGPNFADLATMRDWRVSVAHPGVDREPAMIVIWSLVA
jgi:hypothetical protein